jgi:hypothetical protein
MSTRGEGTRISGGIDDRSSGPLTPLVLERAEIPHYFRQFENAAVLKKLAHANKGPLYQLIGKKAWYETADIIAWLESRKRSGPERCKIAGSDNVTAPALEPAAPKERRGRPTLAAKRRMLEAREKSL